MKQAGEIKRNDESLSNITNPSKEGFLNRSRSNDRSRSNSRRRRGHEIGPNDFRKGFRRRYGRRQGGFRGNGRRRRGYSDDMSF